MIRARFKSPKRGSGLVWIQVNRIPPPKSRAERVQARQGAAIKKSQQLDREADPARGGSEAANLQDSRSGTTPALRATPPN
jgi:hypothetical protein